MKKYKLDTILSFGEYKKHSLKYLIEINTNRLFWYIRTDLDFNNFYLDDNSVKYVSKIANELLLFKKSKLFRICEQIDFILIEDGFLKMLHADYSKKNDKEGEEPGYFLKDYSSKLSKFNVTPKEKRLILNYHFNYWNHPVEKNIPRDLNEFLELNLNLSKKRV